MIVVGIDPGLTGAMAFMDHTGLLSVHDIPTMARGGKGAVVKNQVNAGGLKDIFLMELQDYDKNETTFVVEQMASMPSTNKFGKKVQGAASTLSIGHTAGIIEGVILSNGYRLQLVYPRDWKTQMKVTATKEHARAMALQLYPGHSDKLARVKDHNRAEAILIAHWGMKEYA